VPNPEQGPEELGIVGKWQTVSLEVPDFLEPVRQAIDAFFSFLIRILNILLAVLEILKVFMTGLLDPLIAIIEAIKRLIEALLNDLRQLGIYIHGDFYSLDGPDFQALKGGYRAYQQRMVARLQDRSDPNRPNISSFSTCIAVFLYVGVDLRGVNRIIQLIKSILSLFSRRFPIRSLNQVVRVDATYGYDGATIFSFNKSFFRGFDFKHEDVDENINSPYNAVNLTWQMAPIPGPTFPDTPIIPPAGFLVEFSTAEEGIKIVTERVIEGSAQSMTLQNQPARTEIVECLDEDGRPVILRGGAQQLDLRGAVNWNDAVDITTGEMKTDAVRVYGIKNLNDQAPVQLSDLREGSKHYIQKTFFVGVAQNIFFPGKGFGATFQFDDMPFEAEWKVNSFTKRLQRFNDNRQPEEYFVRVRAVNRSIKSADGFQYTIDQTSLRDREGPVLPVARQPDVDLNDLGPPSPVARILFPDASTQLYLRAVAEALAVMALSRSDIPVTLGKLGKLVNYPPGFGDVLADGLIAPFWETYQDTARRTTGLEDIAKFMMVQVVGRRYVKKFFGEAGANVTKFRKRLFVNCVNLTNRLLTQNLPPLAARKLVIARAEDLLNYQVLFDDDGFEVTLDPDAEPADGFPGGSLLALLQDRDSSMGIAPNPLSMGIGDTRAADRADFAAGDSKVLGRPPHFFFAQAADNSTRGRGSFDTAPVFYNRSNGRINEIAFVRNEIPDSVYEGAEFALSVAVGPQMRPQERGWIAFRVFPQGIPAIDRFFDQILALLRSIQAALESIAETIRRYIEYLQSRIRELQAFLNRINALIQRLLRFFFAIQPAAGLIVVAPGTEGVTSALIGSENKPLSIPDIRPASEIYGGGIVLFAGGIPNLVLDIFTALFKGEDVGAAAAEGAGLPPVNFPPAENPVDFGEIKESAEDAWVGFAGAVGDAADTTEEP